MWQLLPPTALLLLVSAGTRAADVSKAVVSLDPPWDRVLRNDNVTLKCHGTYPLGDNSTQWFHNGIRISNQSPSYFIAAATSKDSGEYRCQTGLSTLSGPVQLEVHKDWLLLQAPRWVFQEGEPILLRCHSWKNIPVYKVQYFQNGIGKMFFYQNSDFYIPKATREHSGSHFCRGIIGSKNESSKAVNIIVQGPAGPSDSPLFLPWHQITFCLVMALLFAVDTGLYFSVHKDLRSSMEDQRNGKVTWSRGS